MNSTEILSEVKNPENFCANSKGEMQISFVHSIRNVELPPQNICATHIVPPPNEEINVLRQQLEHLHENIAQLLNQQRPQRTV